MIVYRHETSLTHPSEGDMGDQWRQGYQLVNVTYNEDTKEYHAVYFYSGGRRGAGGGSRNNN